MIALLLAALVAMAPNALTGVVRDASGAAVPNAVIIVRTTSGAGPDERTVSGPDGRFSLDVPDGEIVLVVRAGGFAEEMRRLPASERPGNLDIVLSPAAVLETVTVTPGRAEGPVSTVPASVNVVTATDIKASPAVVVDDVLRQVPTFSLFRRS